MAEELESAGIRFEMRQTMINNSFHLWGNGGMGTRMCIYTHEDDLEKATSVLDVDNYRRHDSQ